MFEREHHRRIASVLQALDADVLVRHGCLFGGGTAISLRYGEFRESVDINFLVSHLEGYRSLRQRLTGLDGINAIVREGASLQQARDMRADQYGVRTLLMVDGVAIKFELVLEGRIILAAPGALDQVCGVAALGALDLATSKLLANADRWADSSVYSRDLIDLAMMQPSRALLQQASAKARVPYGASIEAALASAIKHLRDQPLRLEQCLKALKMTTPRALLWKRIKAVEPRQIP